MTDEGHEDTRVSGEIMRLVGKIKKCKPQMKHELGAGIAQLVVLGLAVHSVAGSILLWGHFPVEGIFPLELAWVQTPFPPKLLRMRV